MSARASDRVPWPFLLVVDEAGRDVGWAILQGPIQTRDDEATLTRLAAGHRILGFTSFAEFPAWRLPGDRRDYAALCAAWGHCFRDPERYLPAGVPYALLSHSDFTDFTRVSHEAQLGAPRDAPSQTFDFVYSCPPGAWTERCKNWPLALRCLPVLCDELGLTGLLVGRAGAPGLAPHPRLTVTPELAWGELMRAVGRARFVWFPNELDASPRLLAEALCMNTPVVVNRRILGGWKYVNAFTGAFFDDDSNVGEAVRRCLAAPTSPAAWFRNNHGPFVAGERLARFLRRIDPMSAALSRARYVRVTDVVPD